MTVRTYLNPHACRDAYEVAPPGEKEAVDAAIDAAMSVLRSLGFKTDNSDKCEEVVGVLHNYLLESNNEPAPIKYATADEVLVAKLLCGGDLTPEEQAQVDQDLAALDSLDELTPDELEKATQFLNSIKI